MIKNLNPDVLKALASDIDTALKAVAEKHGLSITTGNSRYDDQNAEMKLKICTLDDTGAKHTRERNALNTWSEHLLNGLQYGDKVTLLTRKGKLEYSVAGYVSRSGKLQMTGPDQKTWLFDAAAVVGQIKDGKASVSKAS